MCRVERSAAGTAPPAPPASPAEHPADTGLHDCPSFSQQDPKDATPVIVAGKDQGRPDSNRPDSNNWRVRPNHPSSLSSESDCSRVTWHSEGQAAWNGAATWQKKMGRAGAGCRYRKKTGGGGGGGGGAQQVQGRWRGEMKQQGVGKARSGFRCTGACAMLRPAARHEGAQCGFMPTRRPASIVPAGEH